LNIKDITARFASHPVLNQLTEGIKAQPLAVFSIKGLVGSSAGFACASLFTRLQRPMAIICTDLEEASYLHSDLSNALGANKITFFPSSYKRSVLYDQPDSANIIQRTETLSRLRSEKKPFVTVTYTEAVMERVISKKLLEAKLLQLQTGEKISIDFINEVLHEYGFERTDFVFEPGQFAVRGSIVDIFSFSNAEPYRLDFFGDEVETIRTFSPEDQRSIELVDDICIVPNVQESLEQTDYVSFTEYLPANTIVWVRELAYVTGKINDILDSTLEKYRDSNVEHYRRMLASGAYLREALRTFCTLEQSSAPLLPAVGEFSFNTSLQPSFNKNFELLGQNLMENTVNLYENIFFTDNITQIQRLEEIFEQTSPNVKFKSVGLAVHAGFTDHDLRLCCYTDHQVFERYHKHTVRKQIASKETLSLRDIYNLSSGDYVVHVDHGIGQFAGLEKIEQNGKQQEAIRLIYQNNDFVYVSIHSLHKISKYRGKDGTPPKVHKLGSGVWQNTKNKTKSKVKDIARELIGLYAERKAQPGFSFRPDTYLQTELEASFFYEDTPDQLKATKAVKKAMETDFPMDMLVCGDVGFGKTEVAIRAAFKAVTDSKQVAVLVPTTILALQHYKTFSARLKDFPCRVEYVSRLKKAADIKAVLKDTAEGKVDILIGTHRIVGADVKFKDLGLMIIDEEQKFGVSVKEKLKKFKVNVDSLTLTATPIPRTLQFSLMGARDMAVINTPPPNRHPIQTEVHTFNEDIIRESIVQEIERGGQVFFINNRLDNIYELQNMVERICPGARAIVGHGQMDGEKLEKVMLDFINQEYDVLIATTIIEAGLDIPNANTIIINNAQNFGLSDLHQLRGRVGRSNKKAFCYLLAPPIHVQTPEARRRLKAIEEFSELGSGFNISMQDLDIRGAGNLLGGEQSGFISDIGYETYQKILNEALQELKETEYREFYAHEHKDGETFDPDFKFVTDCVVETDFELLFHDRYIASSTERIKLYRELDNIANEEQLTEFAAMLTDRFGPMPVESSSLLDIVRLRWMAIDMGFERILLKGNKMLIYFVSNAESPYYESPIFGLILAYVQNNGRSCRMEERKERLTLQFDNIVTVADAIAKVREIVPVVEG